jgi:hypothetical protein
VCGGPSQTGKNDSLTVSDPSISPQMASRWPATYGEAWRSRPEEDAPAGQIKVGAAVAHALEELDSVTVPSKSLM